MLALLGLLVVQGLSPDSLFARAESSLAAGDVGSALKIATKIVARHPGDPAAHMLLGRVHYARPVIGRFPALEEFRTAARLSPNDPEPWYWQTKVGFYLRSEDGDYIARVGFIGLFAATPDYKDGWRRFREIYQGPKIWQQVERALARHGDDPVALERRAELWIALEQGARAESLLASVARAGKSTARTSLLRSEAAFLSGRSMDGYAWHDSALAHADDDSTDALWEEAWLIASPDEAARHDAISAQERRAFYQRFWQERDPNLLTPENERLREHYARRAEVRRTFRLLHPQRSLYHSTPARGLKYFEDREQIKRLARAGAVPGPSSEPVAVASRIATLSFEALQDTALPLAARAGITAQGLVYLRHGAPNRRANCVTDLRRPAFALQGCSSSLDYESWLYFTEAGPLGTLFSGGEYFLPVTNEQLHGATVLIHTDRSTLPAPLVVRAWTALFRSADTDLTDVYYRARGDSTAVALWGERGEELRVAGTGLLHVSVSPGVYAFGLDVDSAGVLGRIRRRLIVPSFTPQHLTVSSLVLTPFERTARLPEQLPGREEALRGMPSDLTFAAGTPLAAYVEIYGLMTDRGGRSEYRVRYSFEPARSALGKFLLGAARPVVFEFDRGASGRAAIEQLIIEPDELPAGRYRVTVAVTDLSGNVKSQAAAIVIAIH